MMTSARELSARLADLLRRERAALAEFLLALAEFDRRRLWVELGHASLFSYLTRDLGLSAGAAYYRRTAAELIQRFPDVVEPLRDGRLCFTSVVELSKNLTPENRDQILPRFFHVSKREATAITAELQPDEAAPRRTVVTAVRALASDPRIGRGIGGAPGADSAIAPSVAPTLDHLPAADRGRAEAFHPGETVHANPEPSPQQGPPRPIAPAPVQVEPLTADLRRLHLTVSRRLLDKLAAARDALSHSHPGAGTDEILEAGLDLLIQRHARRRGMVEKPRKSTSTRPVPAAARGVLKGAVPSPPTQSPAPQSPAPESPPRSPTSRSPAPESPAPRSPRRRRAAIPAHVKRAVWLRDGGRCQWPAASGGICGGTLRVELDHVVPVGRGGSSNIENLRCLCHVHDDVAARETFGDDWMDGFTRPKASAPGFRSSRA